MILMTFGLLECFFGYKFFKILNAIKGFISGGVCGALIGLWVSGTMAVGRLPRMLGSGSSILGLLEEGVETVYIGMLVGFLIFGILGALLAHALLMVVVFLHSLIIGALIGALLAFVMGDLSSIPAFAALFGLLLGVASCLLFKYMIVVQTALEGSLLSGAVMAFALAYLADELSVFWSILVIAPALFVAGITVQNRSKQKEDADANPVNVNVSVYTGNAADSVSGTVQSQTPLSRPAPAAGEAQTLSASDASSEDTTVAGNYGMDYTEGNSQKKLFALFQKDIYDEIKYVFPNNSSEKLIYYPLFHEDGSWVCSCGNESSTDTCKFCGMNRQEIQEKMNFAYLNQHRIQRLRAIEEEKNRIEQEKKEDRERKKAEIAAAVRNKKEKMVSFLKKTVKKLTAFWTKHKKKLTAAGIVIVCAIGGFVFFTHNSTCMMQYYLFRANMEENSDGQYRYYHMALDEKENLESFIHLIMISLNNGNIDEAVQMNNRAKELYADNSEYQELEKTLYPEEPYFTTEGGNYDTRITVEINQSDQKYNQKICYALNSQDGQDYLGAVALDESGSYTLAAWTSNDFGYTSERITSEYVLNIEIPDMVTASVEAGEYQSIQYVELSQNNGETIYYTIDGSQPDQNAYVYNGPIECDFGVNEIKAICYSSKGEPSDIMDKVYYVSYEDHNAENGFSGYYYDYVCTGGSIQIADKKSGEVVDTIPGASYPNEYQGILYYIDNNDGSSIKLYEKGSSSTVIQDAGANQLLIAHDSLYYKDSDNQLLRADMDGTNKKLICNLIKHFSKTGDKVLFNFLDESGSYQLFIDGRDAVQKELPAKTGTEYLVWINDSEYAYCIAGNLYLCQNDTEQLLFEYQYSNNTYSTGRVFQYNINDYSDSKVTVVQLCNNSLVYAVDYYSRHTEYNWAVSTVIDKQSSTTTKVWYIYNLETGETTSLGEAEDLFMADDAYYKDGVRINLSN